MVVWRAQLSWIVRPASMTIGCLRMIRFRRRLMSNKLSRRTFLKSTAAGATGLLAVTLLDRTSFPRVVRAAGRTLNVGVIPGQPASHLQDAAKQFMAANPDVTITVNVASGAETFWKANFPQIV